MTVSNNPLSQYFRQPAIYIRLPSGGNFYPPGSLTLPPNGEIAVLPMTAVDEITYRTPDALFNGSALVSVIQSCIPAIRNAWAMPSIDIDTALIAIRIASFGHSLDINTRCPSCNTDDEYAIDLRVVNDKITASDYTQPLTIGDLSFYFRPINYKDINRNNQVQFEQQQALRVLSDDAVDEKVKLEQLQKSTVVINQLALQTVAQSISSIRTPQALVTETPQILEFLQNCTSQVFSQLRDYIVNLKQNSEIKPIDITCKSCKHEYKQIFTLDMTSFFDSAS